jgi:hypothetical protein
VLRPDVTDSEFFLPFYWRNDFVTVGQANRYTAEDKHTVPAETYERHTKFAAM